MWKCWCTAIMVYLLFVFMTLTLCLVPTLSLSIRSQETQMLQPRSLNYYDDVNNNDVDNNDVDNNDDDNNDDDFDYSDELCANYLMSFLEGATDAKDQCEGITNAYTGAGCDRINTNYTAHDDDHDDYFTEFYNVFGGNDFSCCASLKSHYNGYCLSHGFITNEHLLVVSTVLILCQVTLSILKSNKWTFIPEAGVCILVGAFCGLIAYLVPIVDDVDDISFAKEIFINFLLPPMIIDAALSVNKIQFRKMRLTIFMFAVIGTLLSTFLNGFMVHYASGWWATNWDSDSVQMPMMDSLVFGALISAVDPVSIFTLFKNLQLQHTNPLMILLCGESLLNNGVAITLFEFLIRRFNVQQEEGSDYISGSDEVLGTMADFLIVSFGSVFIGIFGGLLCLFFFWVLHGIMNPAMEVANFLVWLIIPYHVAYIFEWNGIMALVATAFFLDIYITAPRNDQTAVNDITPNNKNTQSSQHERILNMNDIHLSITNSNSHALSCCMDDDSASPVTCYTLQNVQIQDVLLRQKRFRMSPVADRHVRFVSHLLAHLAQNLLFLYMGFFLFSSHYIWDLPLMSISVVSCVLSRALMVLTVSILTWQIHLFRKRCVVKHIKYATGQSIPLRISEMVQFIEDPGSQILLVLSGLRGAVSLALMESIPIYNVLTDEGSKYKPEMKAMTSASIIFTMFLFGVGTYYIHKNKRVNT